MTGARGPWLRRTAVAIVLAACVLGTGRFVLAAWGTDGFVHDLGFAPVLLAYPVVAGVILWRRPHPIGYLLLGMGVVLAATNLLEGLLEQPTPPGTTVAWRLVLVVATTTFPLFAMLLPSLGLRFPDGTRLSRRWAVADALYVVGVASVVGAMLLSPTIHGGVRDAGQGWQLANPLATSWTEPVRAVLETVGAASLLPAILLAIAAVIVRFRRSSGVERQQLRWLTYALLTVLLTWPVVAGSALLLFGDEAAALVSAVYPMLLFAVPPVGMGVAISRYRLYDLDRLISRTLSYAVVTGVLAVLYAGAVVALGHVARPLASGGGDVVVALSTLLVAAAFQPVRRRVQSVVDRRFNRARYDAQRTSEAFSQRLRDQVDLGELRAELAATVRSSLAPASLAVWLPEEAAP